MTETYENLFIPEGYNPEKDSPQDEKVLIPEGTNTLYVGSIDKQGPIIPRRKRNSIFQSEAPLYVFKMQLVDADNTGRIIDFQIWASSNDLREYTKFCKATRCKPVKMGRGILYKPLNRWDDPETPGALGMPIKVVIEHHKEILSVPKKDEAGNILKDAKGHWVMEVKRNADGEPYTYLKERVVKTRENGFLIMKSESEKHFILEDYEKEKEASFEMDIPEEDDIPEEQKQAELDFVNDTDSNSGGLMDEVEGEDEGETKGFLED